MRIGFVFAAPAFIACTMALGQAPQDAAPQGQNRTPALRSPIIESDGRVTFNLRAPNATSVTLDGDHPLTDNFHGGRKTTSLTKDDKGVWSVTVGPLRPDLYNYVFNVDGLRVLDPQNRHVSRNANWLIVPGPESFNYQINDVPHGRVSQVWYPSPTLNMTRRMVVYTPPGYETGTTRYPVFYLYHGGGEDELTLSTVGRAPEIFDNLIAQGKAVPMIVVMPNWNTNAALAPSDATEPPATGAGGPPDAMRFPESVVHDLIPYVDKNYRTIADRDHRAVAGSSAGGTQAIITGLRELDSFSWIGLLSPALARVPGAEIKIPLPPDADTRRGPDLGVSIDPVKFEAYFPVLGPSLNARVHLLYFSVGGAEGLWEEEQAGRKAFDEKGVKYQWVTRPGYGHEWSFWRQDIQDFGSQLFKQTSK